MASFSESGSVAVVSVTNTMMFCCHLGNSQKIANEGHFSVIATMLVRGEGIVVASSGGYYLEIILSLAFLLLACYYWITPPKAKPKQSLLPD